MKSFLQQLKIAPPTEEEMWRLKARKNADDGHTSTESNSDSEMELETNQYDNNGNNQFGVTIQKIRDISKTVNFPASHVTTFQALCQAANLPPLRAVKDHKIRWNATYNMIRRAIFLRPAFDMFTKSRDKYKTLTLTSREWELAEFLLHFLAPFNRATIVLQATKRPTLHETFETYEHLFNSIEDVRAQFILMKTKPDWIKQVQTAIDVMWDKLKDYYTGTKTAFAYGDAIILHPSLKLNWFKKQGWNHTIIDEYTERTRTQFQQNYAGSNITPSSQSVPSKRPHSGIDSDSDFEEDEFNEFDSYIKSRRIKGFNNPLQWWGTSSTFLPNMSAMAKDVYAVPATGAGVEREFSISGNIVERRRNRLSPETISNLMQYKRWVAHHGTIARITVDDVDDEMDEVEDEVLESEDDDAVEEVVEWLRMWEQNKTLKKRAEGLAGL